MFSSLSVKNFRVYWIGMFVSLIGTWIQTMAQSWLVFNLTQSSFLLGVVGFFSSLPIFLLSFFGGVAADRFHKKSILMVTQIIFMATAFLLGALTSLGIVQVWQIMAIALINGVVMAFDAPSRQSLVIDIAGKENLLNAIALNSVSFNSARIIGPALAGLFIGIIGMAGCFYLNGLSFVAVIAALFFVKVARPQRELVNKNIYNDLIDGLKFIASEKTILVLIVIVGTMSLFGMSYAVLMPIFAENILHVGAKGMGFLMSAAGLGALLGALNLARLGNYKKKGRLIIFSSIVYSLALMLFGISKSYPFSLLMLGIIGWTTVTATATVNTVLQASVPDKFRGRVMSAFMFTFAGLLPFGNLFSGFLAGLISAPITVVLGGGISLSSFIIILLAKPQILKLL